jgi:zinc transporter
METVQQNPGFLHMSDLSGGGTWLHMCIKHRETGDFLMDVAMLDDLIVEAMTEEDTRSRVRMRNDGIMVLLKAMHVQGDDMADPEDMVSMRVWIDRERVITTREADVDPIREIAARIGAGAGPAAPADFLADLIEVHLDEVDGHIERIEDDVDRLETLIGLHQTETACPTIADTQMRISGFLRHLGPQRPVFEALSASMLPVLTDRARARFDDGLNQLLRYLETLNSLRERIDILNDQVTRIQDRQLNRSSYAFAVAATIFLPLGFVTGLFGVNLMGIPLERSPWGFWVLAAACIGVSALLLIAFRWRKLL